MGMQMGCAMVVATRIEWRGEMMTAEIWSEDAGKGEG